MFHILDQAVETSCNDDSSVSRLCRLSLADIKSSNNFNPPSKGLIEEVLIRKVAEQELPPHLPRRPETKLRFVIEMSTFVTSPWPTIKHLTFAGR